MEEVRKEFQWRHCPRPLVPRVQLAHFDEQELPEALERQLLQLAVRELLPPEWLRAEWLLLAQ